MEVKNAIKALRAGVVIGREVVLKPSSEAFIQSIKELVEKRKQEDFPPPDLKKSVRDLLRSGGFKPAGRNKPASEYLAQSAREDRFPIISNLVDINNYISLLSGFPISLLDLEATSENIVIRYGEPGEKHVFNVSGQEIDIAGLMTVCKSDQGKGIPLGTPVKDFMTGKIKDTTKSVVGIIYAPQDTSDEILGSYVKEFEGMLREFAEATTTEGIIL